jgi:hypothetical protein
MRAHVTTALEVIGFGLISAAAYTINLGICLAVAGLSCIAVGYLAGRK